MSERISQADDGYLDNVENGEVLSNRQLALLESARALMSDGCGRPEPTTFTYRRTTPREKLTLFLGSLMDGTREARSDFMRIPVTKTEDYRCYLKPVGEQGDGWLVLHQEVITDLETGYTDEIFVVYTRKIVPYEDPVTGINTGTKINTDAVDLDYPMKNTVFIDELQSGMNRIAESGMHTGRRGQ